MPQPQPRHVVSSGSGDPVQGSASPGHALLSCGVISALLYVATDLAASQHYPGYSMRAQAVSELFAIGAPTRPVVALLFSVSSVLVLAFALGIWRTAVHRRQQILAVSFGGSATIGLLLWIAFPMHMRGDARSFTDTMHLMLASNPFVLLTLVVVLVSEGGRFRTYTWVTLVLMVGLAVPAFGYADALDANQPTPWLGALERASQYTYQLWQVALSKMLVARCQGGDRLRALGTG